MRIVGAAIVAIVGFLAVGIFEIAIFGKILKDIHKPDLFETTILWLVQLAIPSAAGIRIFQILK